MEKALETGDLEYLELRRKAFPHNLAIKEAIKKACEIAQQEKAEEILNQLLNRVLNDIDITEESIIDLKEKHIGGQNE